MSQKWVKLQTGLVVEADRVTESTANAIATWANGFVVEEREPISDQIVLGINVPTPNGTQRASEGDFVFKYMGDFYVCGPNQFTHDYGLLTRETVLNIPVEPVELVWYDDDGNRHVIGEADLEEDGNNIRIHADISDPSWAKRLGSKLRGSVPKEI